MNIFEKLALSELADASRLGCKSKDEGHFLRRREVMAQMNPRGFRTPKHQPVVGTDGRTRGERRRSVYARLFLGAELTKF
jgi:hypothetical protein